MSWAGILRLNGLLLALFSFTALPPLALSAALGDGEVVHFTETFLVTLGAGIAVWFPVRNCRNDLKVRDGFVVVALFWSVLGIFGGVPFLLGAHLDFTDAVFEAVSGFTTTGATVMSGLDQLSPSILFHRQQLQWLGGMGVIVLAVAVMPMLGVGGMQLYRAEVPGPVKEEKLAPRIAQTARVLWYIYVALTAACALAYLAAGMSVFDAVCHAFTTVATGGYSTHDASFAYFDSLPVEMVANVFMVLGGINFGIHFLVWRGRDLRHYLRDTEVRTYLALVAVFTVIITATLVHTAEYAHWSSALRAATFTVISVITTTGYATADFPHWPLYIPLAVAVISYIGGCAGSTSGGMKVIRIILLYKQGTRESFRLIHPRAQATLKLGGKPVSEAVVDAVWGFYALYVLSSLVLTAAMMAAGLDLESAFGAVIASINLLGPGLGEVATTFAGVPDAVKWLAVVAMLLGRLEVFTLLILFMPAFWRT